MENNEGIVEIWNKYKKNPDAELRNQLVLNYIPLVKSILRKFNIPENSILTNQDLINVGIIGLVEAIEKYEPEQNVKFETFAYNRIKGAIIDELRKVDWLSRGARKKAKDVVETIDRAFVQSGNNSYEEISKRLNLTEKEFNSFIFAYHSSQEAFFYTESTLIEEESQEIEFLENLPTPDSKTTLEELVENEKVQIIYNFLLSLPERDRLIVILYYYENLRFKEIGKILGLSESRVSQIHSSVIKRLRNKFKELDK
ncbi:MAG: sigma-70 family RNA polymerase sigma factor [Candidatus Kapaibacteriota bacterium]|jgi:RNA polymerase sigma factor for flagellar operon FliA